MASKKPAEGVIEEAEGVEITPRSLPISRVWERVDELPQVEGFDLEKNKAELVGIPFIVTGVTYRDGKFKRGNEIITDDYVSVECVTAPPAIYEKRVAKTRKKYADDGIPTESEIGPNELVVFNDSSTGIKRQITSFLHAQGIINCDERLEPGGTDKHVMTGEYGTNPLDYARSEWVEGAKLATEGIAIDGLTCMRGLRISRYENDYTPEGVTYYLA